ncbi:MAG: amphi-Trp domain-containing protein [Candidatus Coatesbacteria bacterium]|nr:amphi-Trp domain-containing protein [Candidatus Coatesbacteria bacterium]
MAKDETFEYESLQDVKSVIKYLRAICDGFDKGLLIFGKRDNQVVLEPRGLIKMNLDVKRKKDRNKITLKLSWRDSATKLTDDSLTIENG